MRRRNLFENFMFLRQTIKISVYGFSSQGMVKAAISNGFQFIGVENVEIIAAYIMNLDCDGAYHAVQWHIDAAKNEAVMRHAIHTASYFSLFFHNFHPPRGLTVALAVC